VGARIPFTLQKSGIEYGQYDRRKTPPEGGFLSDWGAEEEIKIGANEAKQQAKGRK
jgi:hypothetical protein